MLEVAQQTLQALAEASSIPPLRKGHSHWPGAYPKLLVLLEELSHIEVSQIDDQAFLTHLTGLHGVQIGP